MRPTFRPDPRLLGRAPAPLIAALVLALGGGAYLLWSNLGAKPDPLAVEKDPGTVAAKGEVELAPLAEAPVVAQSGGGESAAVAAADVAAGLADPRVWDKDRVDKVLDTFWGREPDIDALLQMVRELGERAVVVEESVWTEEEISTVRGRVEIEGMDLAGEFQIQRNRIEIALDGPSKIRGTESRTFRISLRTGEIGIETSGAYISYLVPETEVQSVHELATARHPVGWEVSVSYSRGTRAQPVLLSDPLAFDYDEYGPLPKEPVWTDEPVAEIVDRTRLEFSAWNQWRSKIEVHKPK